jgi:serine/threonine protein kinase
LLCLHAKLSEGVSLEEHVHRLSPGTQLATWRVEAWQGQGAYGAVYRAVRIGQEHLGPVALKLSLLPWNERFVREAQLLSRLSHPSIPRLLDSGALVHPSGAAEHPFFVMEWVEGTQLYAWAEQHAPSRQELCRVLAQLARALEAMHAAGCVHRDLKGENVLVRLSDRLPVLIDFGSGHFEGAQRLTWQSLAPGTPAYLSPQACLFEISLARNRNGYYPPSPADDLFALGVTAYRLVTGQYPPPMDAQQDEDGAWHVSLPDPRPLLDSNSQVDPRLREVILRLLSNSPEARGTAAQAAEALESAAAEHVPQRLAEPPPAPELPPPHAPAPTRGTDRVEHLGPLAWARAWKPWLALTAVSIYAVLLWNWQPVPRPPAPVFVSAQQTSNSQAPDAGTSAVGDSSPTKPQASNPPSADKKPVAQRPTPKPFPGQALPDKKGQCPVRTQVHINGGCWLEFPSKSTEECTERGALPFQGKCYLPALEPGRKPPPTSSPAEAR